MIKATYFNMQIKPMWLKSKSKARTWNKVEGDQNQDNQEHCYNNEDENLSI